VLSTLQSLQTAEKAVREASRPFQNTLRLRHGRPQLHLKVPHTSFDTITLQSSSY
jgi:hypothetical protein